MVSEAERRVRALLDLGGSPGGSSSPIGSPEVPPGILKRNAELIFGGQAGYRIGKYGTMGLDYLYSAIGEAAGIPAIKQYSKALATGSTGIICLTGEVLLRGKWTRIMVFGASFFVLTSVLDYIEAFVLKAIGGGSKSK